jgi:adenylyl-sulfate kinase
MADQSFKQKGFVLWLTGLSGAGKSTIAEIVEGELRSRGLNIEILDGDIVRKELTRDLGFSKEDREENIKRVTFVAKLLSRNQVACICSFISPYREMRDRIRRETTNFIEVFVDASLESVSERDVKGLYKKALSGEIPNFTGISAPYEVPDMPDLHILTDEQTPLQSATQILEYLEDVGLAPYSKLF